jgi:hypothetical protein
MLDTVQERQVFVAECAAIDVDVEDGGALAEPDTPVAVSLGEVGLVLCGEKTVPNASHHELSQSFYGSFSGTIAIRDEAYSHG